MCIDSTIISTKYFVLMLIYGNIDFEAFTLLSRLFYMCDFE